MKRLMRWGLVGFLALAAAGPAAGRTRVDYQREDSLGVVRLVAEARQLPAEGRVVWLARQLKGRPYVAATLEGRDPERLVVNLRQLDCTTLVETVGALNAAAAQGGPAWPAFVRQLEALRYRHGRLAGYVSRLHYFSEWMADNERRGKVVPVDAGAAASARFSPTLNYMSTHPQAYAALRRHPEWVPLIARAEHRMSGRSVSYIPKNKLGGGRRALGFVHDGDVVAIVTKKRGLDYSHVGFAVWGRDGLLHLLHASSLKKRVIEDATTIKRYMAGQPGQVGIRLVRFTGR